MVFAVFGQTLTHQFINFDDDLYVYNNPGVSHGLTWDDVGQAFTQAHSVNWHPVTWISHMLDCQLYGLRPAGHHLTNVLLHAATAIALFLVLLNLTNGFWPSAFVAAVFAVHPLRVESVAWVAERKDVLSGLFFVLTMGAYVRYARRPGSLARYGWVIFVFALGLMCKSMLVTVPLVLFILDYWPLQRLNSQNLSRLVLEKVPLLALAAAVCAITLWSQSTAIHSGGAFSLSARLANALVASIIYLRQMIWPAGLAVLYPFPLDGTPPWELLLAGAIFIAISAVAWLERRARPWLLMGWLWYLVMLLPVVGIIQVGRQAHADRYTYLPQIGIYIALTWLAAQWRFSRALYGGLMVLLLAALMICTWKQTSYWQDSETLWRRDLDCTQNNDLAHNNLATALVEKGQIEAAMRQYEIALELRPDYADAHYNLGLMLLQTGNVDGAIAQLLACLKINPKYAQAHFRLGDALVRKGQVENAIIQYQDALEALPDFPEAENNLAIALRKVRRVDEAISHYQKALALSPPNADIHVNLANVFLQKDDIAQAINQFETALKIEPSDLETLNNLAWLLATAPQQSLRNGSRAVALASQANDLAHGQNPVILATLAAALAETGQFSDATKSAQHAIELANSSSNAALAQSIASQLKFYQAGQSYHSPNPK